MIVSRNGQFHLEIAGPEWEGTRETFPYADCIIFKKYTQEIRKLHTTDFSPKIDDASNLADDFSIVGSDSLTFVVHYDDCTWLPTGEVTWDLYLYLPDEEMGTPFASGTIEVL